MNPRKSHSIRLIGRRQKGFTLIELLIVGALIALFAGLAVFGVQQQFRSNVRKATIAETRQIGTALDFANLDTDIFPRLCWLTESQNGMDLYSTQLQAPGSIISFSRLDINGRNLDPVASLSARNQWNGPYFALSQTRAGISQGRGGFVYMLFDDLPANGPNSPTTTFGFRWPSDPYNNPYVVYMLDVDGQTQRLSFVNEASVTGDPQGPTRKGNYVNAIVSYGENLIPGGPDGPKVPFNGPASFDALGDSGYQFRLFKGRPGFVSSKGVITHKALLANEYTADRASIWATQFFTGAIPGGYLGIADPGSDDVIFEF